MIKIAVLDDDQNELSSVLKLLEAFQREHTEYSVTVMSFTEPFALLEYTHDHGGFDVYLLDIIMRNLTGIECAQKLRERGDSGEIIFLRKTAVPSRMEDFSPAALFPAKRSGFPSSPIRVWI